MAHLHSTPLEVEASLAARFTEIDAVCAAVDRFLAEQGLASLAFAVNLCCREALTNAIRHGCHSDPGQTVDFRLRRDDDRLLITVRDHGPGFDWRAAIKRATADGPKESGRGLYLLGQYCDGLHFNEMGNELTLHKKIG